MQSQGLARAVAEHLEETKAHAARLEQVFRAVGAEPSSNLSPPVGKLAEHHDELGGSFADAQLADVFHAAAGAATERAEISYYEALLSLAPALELGDARRLLEENLDEERRALERLRGELDRLVEALRQR